MIELIIYEYLKGHMEHEVYMEVPEKPPKRFATVEKVGSSLDNGASSSLFAITCYGDSLYNAALMNESAKKTMGEAVELPEISAVKLNSDYNYTDTENKRYRYRAVFDIWHY